MLGVNNALTSIGQIMTPILSGLILLLLPSQTLPIISAVVFTLILLLWKYAFVNPVQDEESQLLEPLE